MILTKGPCDSQSSNPKEQPGTLQRKGVAVRAQKAVSIAPRASIELSAVWRWRCRRSIALADHLCVGHGRHRACSLNVAGRVSLRALSGPACGLDESLIQRSFVRAAISAPAGSGAACEAYQGPRDHICKWLVAGWRRSSRSAAMAWMDGSLTSRPLQQAASRRAPRRLLFQVFGEQCWSSAPTPSGSAMALCVR